MRNRRLIYIDDKEANLRAFRALLRRDFTVFISSKPEEALDIIGQEDIAVVITDFKMPIMNGVAFLNKVRERYPETVRILLSGHADIDAVIESVNKGEVFRFIKKPWIDELLINEINNAFELHDTRQTLHRKNKELKRAYEELAYFTYSAAHNLTGPVATLRGLLNLIETEPENSKEYVGYLHENLHALEGHLANIISFNKNKIEEVEPKVISFGTMVETLLAEMSALPGFGQMKIVHEEESVGEFRSDFLRIQLMFTNIILNAIKYRDELKSEHTLSIKVNSSRAEAVIEFRDNGVGIAQENLPRIFDIFFREATGQLGSGIGLYIVKQAVDRLNGSVEVESVKGEHTLVRLQIPGFRA